MTKTSETFTEVNLGSGLTSTRHQPVSPSEASGSERVKALDESADVDVNGDPNATRDVDVTAIVSSAKLRGGRRSSSEAGPAYYIDGLEKWEGRIEAIYRRDFAARLVRVLGEEAEEYEAEFENRLVDDDDLDLFEVGAHFYLTVRTVNSRRGSRSRTASISIKRPGRWTAMDVESVRNDARILAHQLSDVF